MIFYWKTLYETSLTQQIACPLAKYCKEGDSNNGTVYGVSIYFPSSFGDYTGNEIISFPYYDNYKYPVEKTLTITLNITDNVPIGGTNFQGKTNVGMSGTFPNYTVYISGYTSRENISSLISSLFAWTIKIGNTVMSKRAFMRVESLVPLSSGSGITYLNYSITVSTIDENATDLSVNSSISSSVLLSSTNSVTFSPAQLTKAEGYVNVYGDYNFVNKEIVSRGLLSTDEETNAKYNFCVDPGFISDTCIGLEYNPETGRWYNPDGDPDNPPPDIGSVWSDFADTDEKVGEGWCSFHLSPPTDGDYPDTIPNKSHFLYQMNEVSEDIMDNVLKDSNDFAKLDWTYGDEKLDDNKKQADYVQEIVFCGGSTNNDDDNTKFNYTNNDRTNTYNARWPNFESKDTNYTNIGF